MATLVIADDHQLIRQGLRSVLQAESDLNIVGEAADGVETIQLVQQLQPDILVLDLMLPGLGGLDVMRQVRRHSPQTRVLILSMHANEAYVLEALRSGAAGYVLKGSNGSKLIEAIRTVIAGRRYLSPPLSERAIDAYVQKAEAMTLDPYTTLTARERQVLHLAAEGCTNAEIALRLSVSPRTTEMYRGTLMRKLGLHTQTDLIRFAIRRGIIPLDD